MTSYAGWVAAAEAGFRFWCANCYRLYKTEPWADLHAAKYGHEVREVVEEYAADEAEALQQFRDGHPIESVIVT